MGAVLGRLASIDRRIIYVVMGLSVLIPILFPLGLKVTVTPATQEAFDAVENLPEGSRVLVSFDYGPSTSAENDPMVAAVMRHCLTRNLRVVAIALYPVGGGSVALQQMQQLAAEFPDKTLGVDYVNLGYKDGGQAAMKRMGEDLPALFPVDATGRPIAELPIMEGVKSYADFGLAATFATGLIGEWWANLVNAQFHIPVIIGPTAVSAAKYYAYLNSENIVGLIGGLKGASEYEKLLVEHHPEVAPLYAKAGVLTATRGMDAQNIAHLVVVGFILLGNLFFVIERRRKRSGGVGTA
jgi:hypothetical protein